MIYPENIGSADGNETRLKTLESIWIQGKLKMWGKWSSYSAAPECSAMFKQLLSNPTISKADLARVLKQLKESGCSDDELQQWFGDMRERGAVSSLTLCDDTEGMIIDGVIGTALINDPSMLHILKDRYVGGGKSKKKMAEEYHEENNDISERTHYRRIECCLSVTEFMLYRPMSEAFGRDPERYYKK